VVKKASKNNYVWRGLKEAVHTINLITENGWDFADFSSKKEKSLENLAARFLKVFIFSSGPVSLEQAAKILIHTEDSALIKTKIRRLYDIINVFKSIGIVQKVRLHNKKPAFEWVGIKNLQLIVDEKKVKCQPLSQSKPSSPSEKENCQLRSNKEDVNNWFSSEEQKNFL
jgi:transcription factor E2F7/8